MLCASKKGELYIEKIGSSCSQHYILKEVKDVATKILTSLLCILEDIGEGRGEFLRFLEEPITSIFKM